MSATFLAADELSELTGRRTHKLQIETLRKQGVPFWVNAAGKPVVPRSAIEGRPASQVQPPRKKWTPPD